MSMTVINFFLAALGLSLLIFIHELGHYWMARRVGMKVEVFSIGFGKPILAWNRKGVLWQIGVLPFGGYVKIAGMEGEEGKEAFEIPDGFYEKSPWARIKVAIMGPLVNIVFAFLVFSLIWAVGGRQKPFEQETHIIGWVDPGSELSRNGVKPGDTISMYNGKEFSGFRDLLYGGLVSDKTIEIKGEKIDYLSGEAKTPYDYELTAYHKEGFPPELKTIGVLKPASFLVFGKFDSENEKHAPLYNSGIAEGDRILWANGELIFSASQLSNVINQPSVYLTIERGKEIIRGRVPRVLVSELEMSPKFLGEFSDWKRELHLENPSEELYFIPYEVDSQGFIGRELAYIDNDLIEESRKDQYFHKGVDITLKPNDRIIAVEGTLTSNGTAILQELKQKKILLMAASGDTLPKTMSFENQDALFVESIPLEQIRESLAHLEEGGNPTHGVKILKPSIPITYKQFTEKSGKKIDERLMQAYGNNLFLFIGSEIREPKVSYNPTPMQVFKDVLSETCHTLSSLVKGNLSPKWLSGPVGMVKIMHDGWSVGIKEALYWIGLISLNLGFINLLPIPVLDGGHISFALWEMFTRKRISTKAIEKMVLPFVVLLIMFFVYITYQDITRIFLR